MTEVPAWLLGDAGLAAAQSTRRLAPGAYELGAAAGGLAAGWLSDACFRGRRGPVIALLSFAAAPAPLLLLLAGAAPREGAGESAGSSAGREALIVASYALMGLFAFGPHVLNGLASREYADRRVQASAGGFTKALGQLGGTLAGYPLGLLLEARGWRALVLVAALAGAAAGVCALPLWSTTPPTQTAAAAALADDKKRG